MHQPENLLTNVWKRTKSDILHFKLANSSKSKNFAREVCQSDSYVIQHTSIMIKIKDIKGDKDVTPIELVKAKPLELKDAP